MSLLTAIPIINTVIDKIFPDKAKADEAKIKLLELQQNGEFRELDKRFEAIVMEAKSDDPWTSRARPSFLYVVYIMLLASIPMGIVYAWNPVGAGNFIVGFQTWLNAIPEDLYWLFGAGYLGYTGARSMDKRKPK